MEDPILFWNAVTIECNRLDHTVERRLRTQAGPTLSSRATAMAHIAMHDAYVLSRAGLGTPVAKNDPYLRAAQQPPFSSAPGTDPLRYAAIAVAAAAAVTLRHLYPNQSSLINSEFTRFCAMWGADDAAHRYGSAIGQAVVDLRKNDGANPDPDTSIPNYMESAARGRHREDPLNGGQGFLGPRYGFVRPFAISSYHPLAKYPDLSSAAYIADVNEVAAKGITHYANQNTRTADETMIGLVWAYDGVSQLGTPPRLYNQVLRVIAIDKALNTEQMARMFFLANVAMGDSGILAWFYKYYYDLWRPVLGIREHDPAMGPGTTVGDNPVNAPCDPFWKPLGAPKTNSSEVSNPSFTPPFPAYPSGHATFGAAAFHAARLYLQSIGQATVHADGSDDVAFQFVSDEVDGKSADADGTVRPRHMRSFTGLHQAIYENSVSRVFLGVHWRFDGTTGHSAAEMFTNATADNIGGVPLGLAIANDIAVGNIKPTPATVKPPAFDATP